MKKTLFSYKTLILMICLVLVLTVTGCGNPKVRITLENEGVVDLELDKKAAPITVENFIGLVDDGFYDGLELQSVAVGLAVVCVKPDGTNPEGTKTIKGEFSDNDIKNTISFEEGVIGMARTGDYDSASGQFFILASDSTNLDGSYAAFGHVIAGMDVIKEIAKMDAKKTIKISSICVIK